MFDFGFSELILIGVVMLVVVGPERLPKVARTAGLLLGRVQRYVSDVKSDIQREMQLEELKALQQQVKQQAQELESTVRQGVASVESEVGQAAEEVRSILPDGTRASETVPVKGEGGSAEAAADPGPVRGGALLASGTEHRPQLELGLDGAAPASAPTPDKGKA